MLNKVHFTSSEYDYLIRGIYAMYLVLDGITPQVDWATFKESVVDAQ